MLADLPLIREQAQPATVQHRPAEHGRTVRTDRTVAGRTRPAKAKDETADLIKKLIGVLQSKAKAKVQERDTDSDDESDESEEE